MPAPRVVITSDSGAVELAQAVIELQRLFTQGIGFGNAAGGQSFTRRTTIGSLRPASRMGLPDNVFGSFVDVTLEAAADLNVNVEVMHNLHLEAPPAHAGAGVNGRRAQALNVRWIVCGLRYKANNNTVVGPAVLTNANVTVLYVDGAVNRDTIELRFYTDLTLGGAQDGELVVSLFFFPSTA